jgi:hypothetical protein
MMIQKKPPLTLPKQPAAVSAAASAPEISNIDQLAYGERLCQILREEWLRTEYNKTAAVDATLARIESDEVFFRRLAITLIRQKCRKRVKAFCQARSAELLSKKIGQ